MRLELAWGRFRRALLRRLRPGYVRAMLARRQGHCDNCPHDIIDARDLKFYRNVCGYWFRDEDDRFRWRGRLRLARAVYAQPEVLLLIEPTSAVDAHTEAAMAARLREARQGLTTVVTTTSPLVLDTADLVLHLIGGRVASTGAHHELWLSDPAYRATVSRTTATRDQEAAQ